MKNHHRQFRVFGFDDAGDLYFGRADHLDIDAFLGQNGEHFRRHAGMAHHPHADNGYLGDAVVYLHPRRPDVIGRLLH